MRKSEVKAAAQGIAPDDADAQGGGRPSDYDPNYAKQAAKLYELGATDIEVAEFFGTSVRTIHRWKLKYEDFCHAGKMGKDASDDRVERSLYHRATGYTFESEKVFQYQGEIVRAKTREHVPPDPVACIFWLKNRRKEAWRDVQRHEHGGPGEFDQLSDEELAEEIRREAEAIVRLSAADATGTQH